MAQTSWTVIWTLLQHRLMVCYSTLPQSLPHCLRQASESTSGWVALGSSSWGNPWHENGSCQVTAACLRRASLPSHEKTRKGRSLSTQPRSQVINVKKNINSGPFCDLLGGVGSRSVSLLVVPNIHSWCWTAGHTKNLKSINFITPMGKRLSKCQRQMDWSGALSLTSSVHTAFVCTLEKGKQLWIDAEPMVGSNFCPFWGAPSACCFLAASTLASSRCKWTRHHTRQQIHADPNLDALVPCLQPPSSSPVKLQPQCCNAVTNSQEPCKQLGFIWFHMIWGSHPCCSSAAASACFCLGGGSGLGFRSTYTTTLDGARCSTFNEAPCSTIYWIKEMTCGAFNQVESKYATWNCCFPLHACPVAGLTTISDPSSLP